MGGFQQRCQFRLGQGTRKIKPLNQITFVFCQDMGARARQPLGNGGA